MTEHRKRSTSNVHDVLVPDSTVDMDFIEHNPEAIFDFITMKSIQDRYGITESPRASSHDRYSENEVVYQNEAEFETFVQQFPIDDSIAECFAASFGDVPSKQESKFVSGGKRPQISTKYSKLKKKFGFKNSDEASLLSEEEVWSRDSKRSRKRGVFSKRHKWRNFSSGLNKKSVNFSGHSEKYGSANASDVTSSGQQMMTRDLRNSTESDDVNRTDSCSVSDSQITSYSETFSHEMDQTVPVINERSQSKIPVLHSRSLDSYIYKSNQRHSSPKDHQPELQDCFTDMLLGNSSDIIQKIEDLPPSDVLALRDIHGNNLLHRSVLHGNGDVIKYVLGKFPEMTSEMNLANETAIEIAAKFGKYECLKVILERYQRRKSPGVSLVNRLMNICAQHGQADCLSLLLTYMSRELHCTNTLPGDTRGNTAAHLAARNGHIHCLQALVASGYDVTSENLLQKRPLHVAHQSRSHACFEYLLLLNICEELLSSLRVQTRLNARLSEHMCAVKPSLEHVKVCLKRYGTLCSETKQLLTENKLSIIQTLNNLQEDLGMFVQHTSMDSASKRKEARDKLEELNGEIERLEDTFEFSPFAEMDGALTKVFASLDDITTPNGEIHTTVDIEDNSSILSSLIRDIHKECMLENWDTNDVYNKYLKNYKNSNGVNEQISTHAFNLHSDIVHKTKKHTNDTDNVPVGLTRGKNMHEEQGDNKNIGESHDVIKTETDKLKVRNKSEHTRNTLESAQIEGKGNVDILFRRTHGDTRTYEHHGGDSNTHMKYNIDDSIQAKEAVGETENDITTPLQDITNDLCLDSHRAKFDNSGENHVTDRQTKELQNYTNDGNENTNPTERPFTKLMSLDERIDLLIAGERAREKSSDSEQAASSGASRDSNPEGVGSAGSIYASTFTSITSETSGASDWYSRLGFTSLETTSSDDVTNDVTTDTASYWWDACDNRPDVDSRDFKISLPYGNDIKRKIHLNLENDGSSYDELREHRLKSHLRSIHQTRFSSDKYRERVTTSTGEIMGGFQPLHIDDVSDSGAFKPLRTDGRVLVDVNGALRERNSSHRRVPRLRKRAKPKLFTLEDAIATKPMSESEFRDRYDRKRASGTSAHVSSRWEDMSITDDDDDESISWSEYGSPQQHSVRSDTDTTSGSHTPQSYV